MKKMSFMALVGSTALIATPVPAQQTAQQQQGGNDCGRLVQFLQKDQGRPADQQQQGRMPVTLEQARQFQQNDDQQACRDAIGQLAQAGHDVRQTQAAQPQGAQGAAQVQIQQSPPQVSVRQPMPEIIVRQAPPTVTIDQPQPEIIVRMPPPEVEVSTAPPQVQVRQPEPRIQVTAPPQPPEAQVQQQGQAQVRYEQSGEPIVRYRRGEGEPQVRYEQMSRAAAGQQRPEEQDSQAQMQRDQQQQAARPSGQQQQQPEAQQTEQQDRAAGRQAAAPAGGGQDRALAVLTADRLRGLDVYNAQNNHLGDVRQVVVDGSQALHAVVTYGGFLGIGGRTVAIPIDRFEMRGDRLVVAGMTDDHLRNLPEYKEQDASFRPAAPDQQASIPIWSAAETTGQRQR